MKYRATVIGKTSVITERLKNKRMNKLDKANHLLTAAQQWVKDPDLLNQIDVHFGREKTHRTITVKLDGKPVDLGTCTATGANVRAKLAPERSGYSLYREESDNDPDQPLSDAMCVFNGDVIYAVPPCHGA